MTFTFNTKAKTFLQLGGVRRLEFLKPHLRNYDQNAMSLVKVLDSVMRIYEKMQFEGLHLNNVTFDSLIGYQVWCIEINP